MKKLLTFTLVFIFSLNLYSQWAWGIDFENWNGYENRVVIDTSDNSNNIWQIGKPGKILFDSAYSQPNVIVTDTLGFYPSNDTSSFIIKHCRDIFGGPHGHTIILAFRYKIDSDTISDYGKIETSFNNGQTWIDLLNDSNIINYQLNWINEKPVISGTINTWNETYLNLANLDWFFPYYDTILYKFTFVSDSVDNQKEGWIIDNFWFEDWTESIEEFKNDFNSCVLPNPISENGILKFDNTNNLSTKILIYSTDGKIFKIINTNSDFINLSTTEFESGFYIYKVINNSGNSIGKLIIK